MTQEEKDLLLRDLCARLPYGVIGFYTAIGWKDEYSVLSANVINNIIEGLSFKPYLFPLSSMTEEQYNSLHESGILDNCSHSYEYVNPHIHGVSFIFKEFKTYSLKLIEWLNKNHFDYRGLITKGLAANATGLNIYQS